MGTKNVQLFGTRPRCSNIININDEWQLLLGRHDTQHNDTQHNDIQHNETQHNDI